MMTRESDVLPCLWLRFNDLQNLFSLQIRNFASFQDEGHFLNTSLANQMALLLLSYFCKKTTDEPTPLPTKGQSQMCKSVYIQLLSVLV
jgi:hypothetical protein